MTFPRIGVIGGGQLARMLAPAAEALGVRFSVLAETADAPATQVINEVTVGDYTDYPTLKAFAETVDVITFDHEHVPPAHEDGRARSAQPRMGGDHLGRRCRSVRRSRRIPLHPQDAPRRL
ncbi:hypothetical protein [Brevibacterium aurantiacum]|uniref:hypothetical protein n=1 Tax=Brevibacterium aurantiacum TaxID=273384 RepID=UPI002152E868|nr:hypothetical protein [Brevibacterium aurantiacum]